MIIKCTHSDLADGTLGACLACGEIQPGCEPDARNYECDSCGKRQVFGLEELLIMGQIELIGDYDE